MDADKQTEDETVDLIASGYEWICPDCTVCVQEIEATDTVTCPKCKRTFETVLHDAWE